MLGNLNRNSSVDEPLFRINVNKDTHAHHDECNFFSSSLTKQIHENWNKILDTTPIESNRFEPIDNFHLFICLFACLFHFLYITQFLAFLTLCNFFCECICIYILTNQIKVLFSIFGRLKIIQLKFENLLITIKFYFISSAGEKITNENWRKKTMWIEFGMAQFVFDMSYSTMLLVSHILMFFIPFFSLFFSFRI